MQIDASNYSLMKKNGGIKLVKMGGTQGQPDEKVDGVAVMYVRKFDISKYPPEEVMGDMGPLKLSEILELLSLHQSRVDGMKELLADMAALKVPTTLSEPANE